MSHIGNDGERVLNSLPKDSTERRILGLSFFVGSVIEAVDKALRGGLVVVPAAPALKTICDDAGYRDALLRADMVLPDSSFMVLVWNFLQRDTVNRISGLAYLRELLTRSDMNDPTAAVWVMPSEASAERNQKWLFETFGIVIPDSHVYLAPQYNQGALHDYELLNMIENLRPQQVIINVGGGTQERLGLFLKERLSYSPGIHCTGAAIAFLSGDQANIPVWADRMYLGWLLRIFDDPMRFLPRYMGAISLCGLLFRHRAKLPPLRINSSTKTSSATGLQSGSDNADALRSVHPSDHRAA